MYRVPRGLQVDIWLSTCCCFDKAEEIICDSKSCVCSFLVFAEILVFVCFYIAAVSVPCSCVHYGLCEKVLNII